MRGYHSRKWIKCYDLDGNGYDQYEVMHEETAQAPGYGVFSVIYCEWREKFYVVWRKNRNTTRDTTVMRDPLGPEQHVWHREEVRYGTCAEAAASIHAWNTTFEFPEKRKRYRARDSQKSKVYRWEHQMAKDIGPTEEVKTGEYKDGSSSFVIRNTLERRRGEEFLRTYLQNVLMALGEKDVNLRFRTGGACSTGGWSGIALLPNHKTILVLLHELAHVLHRRWGKGDTDQGHGQEFVGIYAYLLIRFGGVKRDAIVRHAAKANVKMCLHDRYWIWADEAVPVTTDEDFTTRVQARAA